MATLTALLLSLFFLNETKLYCVSLFNIFAQCQQHRCWCGRLPAYFFIYSDSRKRWLSSQGQTALVFFYLLLKKNKKQNGSIHYFLFRLELELLFCFPVPSTCSLCVTNNEGVVVIFRLKLRCVVLNLRLHEACSCL